MKLLAPLVATWFSFDARITAFYNDDMDYWTQTPEQRAEILMRALCLLLIADKFCVSHDSFAALAEHLQFQYSSLKSWFR